MAARYCKMSLVLSVFPAPDSPLINERKLISNHSECFMTARHEHKERGENK